MYTSSYYYERPWTQLPQFGFLKRLQRKFIKPPPPPGTSCSKKNVTFSKIIVGDLYESGHSDDLENFSKICPDNGLSIQLLMLVLSAPTHFDHREAIRNTWGHHESPDVAVAFLLGNSQNQGVEDRLTAENALYGDLIRGHFHDTYDNLTLKTVSMLEWTGVHCSKARFLLKVDDDMFINVPKLLEFVTARVDVGRSIFGRLADGWPALRDRSSKWYVSWEEYGLDRYPAFTTGPAYLLTADVVQDLYCEALGMPFFKLEDVFVTGMVAERLNVSRIGVKEFLNVRVEPEALDHCRLNRLISIHDLGQTEQLELWKMLHETSDRC
ncbi:hypothetical protein quinque_009802 [Culex quinquefasciatus]